MDLKQLKEFIKKLVELDTQTNYSTTINQLRTSINNIKMKSGTIYHTKAYSGYIPSKNQNSYTKN